jgi:type II secretory pathway pseudopilin PulG
MATRRTSIDVLLAVVGSVCGTLLAGALQDSLALNLVGAVVGAAVPPLVSATGRTRHLRAAMAILVTVIALGITYSGAQIVSAASGAAILPPLVERHTTSTGSATGPRHVPATTRPPQTTSRAPSAFDIVVSVTNAKCVYRPAGASGNGYLRITFQLIMIGALPGRTPLLVPITAVGNTGLHTASTVSMTQEQQPAVVSLPLGSHDRDFRHEITVTADPRNAIAESSETNNRLHVAITIEPASASAKIPQCVVTAGPEPAAPGRPGVSSGTTPPI